MKKSIFFLMLPFSILSFAFGQGRVGINTNTPLALLHVKDSSVLFTGVTGLLPSTPGNSNGISKPSKGYTYY